MRKAFYLLVAIGLLTIPALAQEKKKTKPVTATPVANNDATYFSNVKYRLIGPFRGGRCAAVTGSYKNKTTFYFGATGAVYGKQPMAAVTGKIFQINISADQSVQ